MPSLINAIAIAQGAFRAIQIVLFVCMVVCAIFTILVVLFQPGNSDGIGAVTGQSETFLGKDIDDSTSAKLKKLTIIALCVIIAFSVLFFLVSSEILFTVGATPVA